MNHILQNLIEEIKDCDNGISDYAMLVSALQNTCEELAERYHICLKCCRYKEIKHWPEYHEVDNIRSIENWSQYYCPACGYSE